jgi:LmbE family N-acetylglucosaminyl deacetylase
MLEKLNVLGNVLYVAAHPDDENTRLITWFSKEKQVNTGYFSFTRGDGGQNLIGPEIRETLGVIRTQELLAARRIDDGVQFFSRAVDFGYSKHPDETFTIWDREETLADLVWVIRTFRPDVIINRFNDVPGTTHGHHTASAILAQEAFHLAGDASAFPEQLEYVDPWQPSAMYWNTYWWRRDSEQKDISELIACNIGAYNPMLGKSYSEIAAESRSMHKSQGFGASGSRGDQLDYLQYVDGTRAKEDVFEHIDISWGRVPGGAAIDLLVDNLLEDFEVQRPSLLVPGLLQLRRSVSGIRDDFWREIKLREIDELIYACTGMFLEARSTEMMATPGEHVSVYLEAINRSEIPVRLLSCRIGHTLAEVDVQASLENNRSLELESDIVIPEGMPCSQPYWLREEGSMGMFAVDNQLLVGKPENDPAVTATFVLDVGGSTIEFKRPLVYKENDRVEGEVYRPFVIGLPVFVNFDEPVYLFSNGGPKTVSVRVTAGRDGVDCTVDLPLGEGWSVYPQSVQLHFDKAGEERLVDFTVEPPERASNITGTTRAMYHGATYTKGVRVIDYDHIPYIVLFPEASSKFVNIDIRKNGNRIGYIMGAGDEMPASLRQIGYDVEIVNDMIHSAESLGSYDAVIVGVRALNTVEGMKMHMDELLEYVHNGGNLIVQYSTTYGLDVENFSPYTIDLSRNRVTSEGAEMRVLQPEHPILNVPNKISAEDFEGWVQERGLYFPQDWDNAYTAILSTNDPGESPLDGGILVAEYGKGHYIYTSFSWFRQLPAGVPGAFRLFANMISLGSK